MLERSLVACSYKSPCPKELQYPNRGARKGSWEAPMQVPEHRIQDPRHSELLLFLRIQDPSGNSADRQQPQGRNVPECMVLRVLYWEPYLPKGSSVVFLVTTCFHLRDYNILPKNGATFELLGMVLDRCLAFGYLDPYSAGW